MRLSVWYRTHAGANTKPRPAWYDRRIALASLRASLDEVAEPVDFTFVVDGAMPPELADQVRSSDRVVHISGGLASSSFRACVDVAVAQARRDPDDTVYWLAEDDYLYRPEAMPRLMAGFAALEHVDYLTVYVCDTDAWHATHPSQPLRPAPPLPQGRDAVTEASWRAVSETTSTMGVRRRALLEDAWLLKLGSRAGAPFDGSTWHAVAGVQPFSWRHLLSDLDPAPSARGVAKVVGKPVMRVVLNAATVVGRRSRVLAAPVHDLAMHAEVGLVPSDQGWDELAAQARARLNSSS